MMEQLQNYFNKNLEAFWEVREITREMKDLVESTFGGKEAAKVRGMIDASSYREYESDVLKKELFRTFFNATDKLGAPSFYLWAKVIEEIGSISHMSEKLAIRMRLMLEH